MILKGGVDVRSKQFEALLFGWIVVFAIIILSSIILAFVLKFTTLAPSLVPWITLCIGIFSLFIGGIVAGAKGGVRGWAIGGLIGLGFTIFTLLVQFLGYKEWFTMSQSLHHIGYTCVACLGGMIGVNVTPKQAEAD